MPINLEGTEPIDEAADQLQAPSGINLAGTSILDPAQAAQGQAEEKYGGPGQETLTAVEAASRGLVGRSATAALERGATSIGVPGLTPAEQAGREVANPLISGGVEAGTFGASMLSGVGEAALLGKVGKGAAALGKMAEIGGPAAGIVERLAAKGIAPGAEFAALAADNEVARAINQDPSQSLGTAALNIGLAGVIGGAGGAVLGSIAPLWKTALNKMGVEKLATDFMGETEALKTTQNPLQSATRELSDRMASSDEMWRTMSDTKPEVLAQAMPEDVPINRARIDGQIQDISDQMTSKIEKAAESIKTKSAVPYLAEDLNNFQEVATNPNATSAEKYSALNKLKNTLAGYAQWGEKFGATEETSAKGQLGRALSNIIRPALEDQKVWGKAGRVQQVTNEAITDMIRATKDFRPQVTTNTLGEAAVAPEKVQTLLNQSNAGKVGRKATVVGNYLDATQKYADAINKVHIENGLESPLTSKLNPTPVIDHALNTPLTPGVQLARWVNKNGSALIGRGAGEAGAAVVGGGLGSLVGHPLLGAWMGEKVLAPVFSAFITPLAKTAIDSEGAKASVDYIGNVIKGQKLLKNAAGSLFKAGAEIIPKELMPTQSSRDKLEKSLEYASNPQSMMNVGGSLGHYMPEHAQAAAQTAMAAKNLFDQLKPKQSQPNPLDELSNIDPYKQAAYDRQLDIASQPLLVLKHAREGTLQIADLNTINTVYPGLLKKIASETYEQMIQSKTDGNAIPYKQRLSISMLTGQPLDSTMSQPIRAVIMAANAPKGPPPAPITKQKKVSKSTASVMEKSTALLQTPDQSRAASRVQT